MKLVLAALVALLLAGCAGDGASPFPTAPEPSTSQLPRPPAPYTATEVWGFVVDVSGVCIDGATVEVVRGQGGGQRVEQETPCNAWAYDNGFALTDLTPGVEMTLRASAPGYRPAQQTVIPSRGGTVIELAKIP